MTSSADMSIGFIGFGIMGRHMAGHLLEAGYDLHVHTRTKSTAMAIVERGATWHDTPEAIARRVNVVITMLGIPAEVESVYLGTGGVIEQARPGTYLVDMTTSSPELAVRIRDAAAPKGLHALDAPVSGGEKGAREAGLTIMVGGDADAFRTVAPLLRCMGSNVVHQGAAGNGQHAKLCNQIINANTIIGVAEGLAYAEAAGLDIDTVLRSITTGSAASFHLSNTGPKMVANDFAPGFAIRHMVKDLALAASGAATLGMELPGLAGALARYRELMAGGVGDQGVQAIYGRCKTSRNRS